MAKIKKDGWQNVLTGLNIMGRDKKMSTQAEFTRLSQGDAESIYSVDKLAKKIVDRPVVECFKKSPIFENGGDDATFSESVHEKIISPYQYQKKFIQAAKWARLYGAGFLVFGIRDGRLPNEPVDYKNIRSVDWIQPLHRWELGYSVIERDVSQPFYREPVIYTLNEVGGSPDEAVGFTIHRSRLVRIDGETLPDEFFKLNGYYHDSVLNSLQNALRNFASSHDSAASLLDDFAQAVFKIQNLGNLIAAGKDDQVIKRLQLIDATRSVVRGIVLDSEEDFDRKVTALTGLDAILDKMGDKLVGESEFPHTVLLGEGSTGNLSGAGESETKQWNDYIKGLQMNWVKPAYMDGLKLLMSARNAAVKWTDKFDMSFPPLEEMSEEKQASINKTQAEADQIYIQNQVLSPDEVAVSRFGGDEYSLKTIIDVEERQENLEADDETIPPTDPEPTPEPQPEPTPVNDEVDHYHEFDGYMSGMAIMNDDGTHYHEIKMTIYEQGSPTTKERIITTEDSVNSAYHTHFIDNDSPTGPSVEVKVDEDGLTPKDRTPPKSAQMNAEKVLQWREEYPDEIKGMTSVGWGRAKQLAEGKPLSLSTIKKMAQFARHEKNAQLSDENKETPWKDNGHVAWLGWGGDTGIRWAKKISEKASK
jgi:phage-related protein (TIGR01555 family)